jgi:1-acyl-sn-glycerol-3-phosphate acyltransferase
LIEKILKVDKTPPKKIKAALIKGYSVINFPEGTTFYQPQSSLISARLQWPKIKAAVIPIAI